MVRHSKGLRAKTRYKVSKGRFSLAEALQEFNLDERVAIRINAAVQKGMPSAKFQGVQGKVIEKRGRSFVVEIKDQKKTKHIISRPEHLIKL